MLTLPSPFTSPQEEHPVHSSIAHANFWIRLLPSATKTFPLPATATPVGKLNCPSPLPGQPHFVRKVPVFVNFWMRELKSATKTFPLPSTATPVGWSNYSSSPPPRLHLVTTKLAGVCAWMPPSAQVPTERSRHRPTAGPQ